MNEPSSGTLDASKVGGRLRAERERRGISLRELARRVGVSPSLVSQIELDRVNPSVSTLYALVTELGMTMSDVFGDSRPGERAAPQLGSPPVAGHDVIEQLADVPLGARRRLGPLISTDARHHATRCSEGIPMSSGDIGHGSSRASSLSRW